MHKKSSSNKLMGDFTATRWSNIHIDIIVSYKTYIGNSTFTFSETLAACKTRDQISV